MHCWWRPHIFRLRMWTEAIQRLRHLLAIMTAAFTDPSFWKPYYDGVYVVGGTCNPCNIF